MEKLLYATKFGYFTILRGDDIFAQVTALSSGTVYDNGVTALGAQYSAIFASVPGTVICGDTSKANIASLQTICPAISFVQQATTGSAWISETQMVSEDCGYKFSYWFEDGRGNFMSSLISENYDPHFYFISTTNAHFPIGYCSTDSTYGWIECAFLVCKSDGSDYRLVTFVFGDNNNRVGNAGLATPSTNGVNILQDFLGQVTPGRPDPYGPVNPSGQGGGTSQYDPYSSDDIDYNLLPEVSAVGTGFLSLWCPTEQQMLDLSSYMWNANVFTLEFWRKLIADPIQLVYGLNIIPLDLRAAGIVGDSPEDVVVGMISTGISMDYLTSQWVELDCGTIDIEEDMLGSYMDYDPYTKMDIYLPYIGYRALKVDDFMPGTMAIKYKIDLLTGACVAQIKSTKFSYHSDELDSIIYQFIGNCATQIPVTATQYADAVRSAITTAAAIGTVALLGGAGAALGAAGAGAEIMPVAPASIAGALPTGPAMVSVDSSLYASMSQYNAMTMAGAGPAASAASSLMNVGQVHAGASAASNVLNTKPNVQRSGAIGGAAGMLSTQKPYIVFTRPRIAHPEDQNKYTGYPSFMTKKLSDLVGFTQIQAIHLEGLACTSAELAEVDALLKSGVIF